MEVCKKHKLIIMVLAIIAVCVLPKSVAAIEETSIEETSIKETSIKENFLAATPLEDIPEPEEETIPETEDETIPEPEENTAPQTDESSQRYINFQLGTQCWQEPMIFSSDEVPLVPLRQLGEKVGAQVIWHQESGALFFVRCGWMVVFHPQLKAVYTVNQQEGNIVWEKTQSEEKLVLQNNGSYLSSSMLSYLGMQASWDESILSLNIVLDDQIYNSTEKTLAYEKVWALIKEDMEGEKAKLPQLIGQYKTYFNTGEKNRSLNLKRASSAVDGIVLAPGEVFSFNKIVGPRTPENGYTKAIIFVSGNESYDYGGGVCQVSSTIYNAVLAAGLPVLERYSHSLPVAYVPKGYDATVAYGYKDLRFSNNRKEAITIRCLVDGDMLNVEIWD